MDRDTFERLRQVVYEKSGISLDENKEALVSDKVDERIKALGLGDLPSYIDLVLRDRSGEEVVQMLDAISANVSEFFREKSQFDFMIEAYSRWLKEGQKSFRFWSSASHTGEEPYSIAMTLLSLEKKKNIDLKILATDISTRALAKSIAGEYTEKNIQQIPGNYLKNYFKKVSTDGGNIYKITNEIKQLVVFRRLNLSSPPFPMRGPFDAVFCRNVMNYFDDSVRLRLLEEIHKLLKPGGYLITGMKEDMADISNEFVTVRPSIFMKK